MKCVFISFTSPRGSPATFISIPVLGHLSNAQVRSNSWCTWTHSGSREQKLEKNGAKHKPSLTPRQPPRVIIALTPKRSKLMLIIIFFSNVAVAPTQHSAEKKVTHYNRWSSTVKTDIESWELRLTRGNRLNHIHLEKQLRVKTVCAPAKTTGKPKQLKDEVAATVVVGMISPLGNAYVRIWYWAGGS